MKKLRVLVLVHEDLVPPDSLSGYSDKEILEWKTEFDVVATLREMGHEAYFWENIEGGHGAGADNRQTARFFALAYAFLRSRLFR